MRIVTAGSTAAVFGFGLLLAGCGHSDPGPPTLSVSCDGSLMLAGAASVSTTSTGSGTTTLSFPDPANPGQTGTLPIEPGRACVITPVVASGKGDADSSRSSASHPKGM